MISLGVDQRLVAVRQLVEDLADRADRAADLDQLALELEQLLDGLRGRLADDLVLDVVDGVADPVGEREVAVDEVVGDRPQQVIRAVLEDRRDAAGQVVRRRADPSPRCGRSAGTRGRARCRARRRRPRRRSSGGTGRCGRRRRSSRSWPAGCPPARPRRSAGGGRGPRRPAAPGRRRCDEVDPDRASGLRSSSGSSPARPRPRALVRPALERDDPDRARLSGRSGRVLRWTRTPSGIVGSSSSEREPGFGRIRGHRRRVLRRRLAARSRPLAADRAVQHTRPLPAPAAQSRAGGMATAVTPAATTNSPTMIDAASRDAHSSSAPTTNGSRNGRSRSASGMNSR